MSLSALYFHFAASVISARADVVAPSVARDGRILAQRVRLCLLPGEPLASAILTARACCRLVVAAIVCAVVCGGVRRCLALVIVAAVVSAAQATNAVVFGADNTPSSKAMVSVAVSCNTLPHPRANAPKTFDTSSYNGMFATMLLVATPAVTTRGEAAVCYS
ncbi:hypothetical protein BAUCODRAFT_451662 [Baudoinia panamericana UAMH 10762]|uniref:Uncharacterized protein n=1 Tax=Baudoinia panamericana (strain UAMH 10762) TaxID=717646 RepID=M2NEL6_BAUPA|nr:uncharacterized protein BAUCODRAFT_451662 [Baudoinia panamericana UAMH 10762]EMC97410.1 hypothetical protein BAUCODRAFT_451662 [Baudoinia panamericana UAMH 10762]